MLFNPVKRLKKCNTSRKISKQKKIKKKMIKGEDVVQSEQGPSYRYDIVLFVIVVLIGVLVCGRHLKTAIGSSEWWQKMYSHWNQWDADDVRLRLIFSYLWRGCNVFKLKQASLLLASRRAASGRMMKRWVQNDKSLGRFAAYPQGWKSIIEYAVGFH